MSTFYFSHLTILILPLRRKTDPQQVFLAKITMKQEGNGVMNGAPAANVRGTSVLVLEAILGEPAGNSAS